MVGATIVGDLVTHEAAPGRPVAVAVADQRADALAALAARYPVQTVVADLSTPAAITALVREFDLVIGALSSHLGFQTLRAVIEAARPYVDISFMAEDALALDELARARGTCAVVDCGVSPGVGTMAAGYAAAALDPCERLEILVGGVPHERRWPFEYKAAFAPADVIEEYVRPARMVEHGRVVTYPALSGVELVHVDGVGTLEAFATDGLRSLVRTLSVPTMIEKTLRWPGHAAQMAVLREIGLFSDSPIEVGGHSVVPREVAAALLFRRWSYGEDEIDMTVMRVTATGRRHGQTMELRWDMVDRRVPGGPTSMSRTTAFPATLVARMVLDGRIHTPGIHTPERLGQIPGVFDDVLAGLRARGITVAFGERRVG